MAAGRHTTRRSRRRASTVLLALALVLAVAGAGWGALQVFGGGEVGNASEECTDDAVSLSVVPDLADLVEKAVAATAGRGACPRVEVVTQTPAEFAADVAAGERHDLWVPDSLLRAERLAAAGLSASPVSVGLASSPVGLVSGPSADRPASWAAALGSGRVELGDLAVDGASTMALLGPLAEGDATGADEEQSRAALVPAAQQYGARVAESQVETRDLATVGATTSALVPVTEARFLAQRRANEALTLVTPRTGSVLMTYPLLATRGATGAAVSLGKEIAAWFESVEARQQLADAGLRVATGQALPGDVGMGDVAVLPMPPDDAVATTLTAWQVLSVPSSVLAVFDASGSMDFAAGTSTRMQLAVDAAATALDAFPRHARVGMWAFSIDQGGPGQDYRQLAPMRLLSDDVAGGRTQYDLLRERMPVLLDITQGGTGLYDTTLAAYREAVEEYDDRFFNSVILLSDGANDDPGSIGLDQLLATLEEERDPVRPVRIIAVGISGDADLQALKRIAGATGGQAYLAEDPRDILEVFSQALVGR